MRPDQRVVISLPLSELWNDTGTVAARRGEQLGALEIASLLRDRPIQFVVADAGPLQWIPRSEAFAFWKTEVRPRLVPARAERYQLQSYPGEYCYVATRWTLTDGEEEALILLEKHH